jgi:hypothetical protein
MPADWGGPRPTSRPHMAWWSGRPQPWRAPARDQGGAMLWRRRGGGKEGGRTGFSPGTHRWGRFGRRMAGGEQFGGGGARDLRGNPVNRWRLRAVEVDSLDGEEHGDTMELLSTSAGLGEARNGDPRWQPWRPCSVQRGKHRRKREIGKGEGRMGGRRRGLVGHL